jgi:hypothetical protein
MAGHPLYSPTPRRRCGDWGGGVCRATKQADFCQNKRAAWFVQVRETFGNRAKPCKRCSTLMRSTTYIHVNAVYVTILQSVSITLPNSNLIFQQLPKFVGYAGTAQFLKLWGEHPMTMPLIPKPSFDLKRRARACMLSSLPITISCICEISPTF